jgi:hypothetical protein
VEERLFGNSYTTTDHLGNTFSSEREMCDKYGVKYHAYAGRKNKHPEHSLEQWLFGVPKSLLTDHLGNSFTSLAKKCSFHGIAPSVYSYRKEAHPDWDEKTLLTPSETVGKNEILLSLYAEARDSDDITADLVKSRYAAGWSADEIMGRSGRGMARKIITGLQPNILLVAISYHTYKNKKSINVPLMLCGSQPHFIVKIRATEKYSIMNADEILAFDGTEPELVFDTYI